MLFSSTRIALATLICSAGMLGCSEPTEEETETLQVARISSAISALSHDVAGFLFEIICDNGFTHVEYVPLEDELMPQWLDPLAGAEHDFSDLFAVIEAPAECKVQATPMQNPKTPSEECAPVTGVFSVYPEQTTEIVLMAQCEGNPTGAGDIVAGLNDPPVITDLDINKFICTGEELVITATAEDPNGDPITYNWQIVTWPISIGGQNATLTWSGNQATFTADEPGQYQVTVTVTDSYGASTALTFPVHVSDCGCECPEGFEPTPAGDECIHTDYVEATPPSDPRSVCQALPNPNYGRDGAIYPGGTIVKNSYWGEIWDHDVGQPGDDDPDSRQNNVGIWACESEIYPGGGTYATQTPVGEWIGFAVCLDVAQSGDYLVGLAGDNRIRFTVNGNVVFERDTSDIENFTHWWLTPLPLNSGMNIVELWGKNDGQAASFGADIAGPFTSGSLVDDASMIAADYANNVIFSTADMVGGMFNVGGTVGFSCPDGYSYDVCETGMCVNIERTECVTQNS